MNGPDAEEIIAVVDNQDNMISKSSPKEAHSSGKLHREAAALIFNEKGEILVQERSDNEKLDSSGAGHFMFDETYLEGVIREVKEELGLDISASKFNEILKVRLSGSNGLNNRFVTFFEVNGNYKIKDMKLELSEVKSVTYYDLKELNELLKKEPTRFARGFAYILKHFQKRNNL